MVAPCPPTNFSQGLIPNVCQSFAGVRLDMSTGGLGRRGSTNSVFTLAMNHRKSLFTPSVNHR